MAALPKIQLDCWKDPKGYHLAKTVPPNLLRVVRNGRTNDKLELCRPLDDFSALKKGLDDAVEDILRRNTAKRPKPN